MTASALRVLVTGHRGYVGCVLTPMLRAEGHRVTGLDTDLYRGCDFGNLPLPRPDLVADIRDVSAADLEGFDAIVHLAGLSNDPLGDLDPELTHAINAEATLTLARAARAAGVRRFLFSSSCSNYGASGTDGWLDETAPLNPVTPYAVSKVVTEEKLDRLADAEFSPVFLRSGTAYGLSPRLRFDLVVNNLTAWAMATGQVRLKSDGSAWRPLVHVADMAQAFCKALTCPRDRIHRQAFNVGHAEDCMTIRDLARRIEALLPDTRVTFGEGHGTDPRSYRVDCSKIAGIGFRPRWNLQRGVGELRRALARHGVPVAEFEGSGFGRVARIRKLLDAGILDRRLRFRAGP